MYHEAVDAMTFLRLALLGSVAATVSCTKVPEVFVCDDDAQCRLAQRAGRCEPTGYCSFPASDCPSQWRYDSSADPAFADQCALAVDCGATFSPLDGATTGTCVEGSAPSIDGDLVDWPDTLFTTAVTYATADAAGGTWSADATINDADLSALVAWRWDARFLYVAARITDDQILINDTEELWNNDAFELFLDGANDRLGPYGVDDHQLIVRADGVAGSRRNGVAVALPVGLVLGVDQLDATHWTLELAIPFAVLGDAPVSAGRVIGVDIVLEDRETMTGYIQSHLTYAKVTPAPADCTTTCTGECVPSCSTVHFVPLQLGSRAPRS